MSNEEIDESVYLRVTTCLSKYGNFESIPVPVLEYAADRGTRVHKYCELHAHSMLFEEVDADCKPYVEAFIKWFDYHVEKVISTEDRFYCDNLKIQGSPDLICKLNSDPEGVLSVIDIKTSSKYSKSWELQTAAYRYLCIQNNVSVSKRVIVHLKNDSDYKMISLDEDEHGVNYSNSIHLYCCALSLHRFFEKKKKS